MGVMACFASLVGIQMARFPRRKGFVTVSADRLITSAFGELVAATDGSMAGSAQPLQKRAVLFANREELRMALGSRAGASHKGRLRSKNYRCDGASGILQQRRFRGGRLGGEEIPLEVNRQSHYRNPCER